MPSNLLASAKKNIQAKEASVNKKFEAWEGDLRGGAWKKPVTTTDGDWNCLGPQKENKSDSERKKQEQAKFQAKLRTQDQVARRTISEPI
jgi:hypothetical protein